MTPVARTMEVYRRSAMHQQEEEEVGLLVPRHKLQISFFVLKASAMHVLHLDLRGL